MLLWENCEKLTFCFGAKSSFFNVVTTFLTTKSCHDKSQHGSWIVMIVYQPFLVTRMAENKACSALFHFVYSVLSRLRVQSNQKNPYKGLDQSKEEWMVILRKIQFKGEESFPWQGLKRSMPFVCPINKIIFLKTTTNHLQANNMCYLVITWKWELLPSSWYNASACLPTHSAGCRSYVDCLTPI